ncbi:hypothetical protein ACFLZW_04245 [Chloroflexota bacterium]
MVRIMHFVRWVFLGLRFVIPWLMRVMSHTIRLIATSIASLWVGVPTAVNRIADEWSTRALAAGIPTEYDTFLFYASAGVALVTIVSGWIILAFVTVGILMWLF